MQRSDRRNIVGTALALVALGSVAMTALTFGATLWWPLELLTHFRVQYLTVQVPLLIALLVLHRPFSAAALTAAVIVNAWPLVPYLPLAGGTANANAAESALRVMAVNVLWKNGDEGPLLDSIEQQQPDVIVVSEFTEAWEARLEPLAATHPHSVRITGYGAFGIAVYSTRPLIRKKPFSLVSTPAIDVTVELPDGEMRIIGVHLRPPVSARSSQERNAQLERLAAMAQDTSSPLIVTGDFNISPYSPWFRTLLRDGTLTDARAGQWPAATWPVERPMLGTPIDHVVIGRGIEVAAFARLGDVGSDHYPVMADLLLSKD